MIEVNGIDMEREAYRVTTDDGTRAFVPEGLVAEMLGISRRPGHEEVYRWLAHHRRDLETALNKTKSGKRPRAPFDRITLQEDT